MMDRLRSPVRTLAVTAFLICALSLAGLDMSHARPSKASQSVHVNGLPCNAVCKAYMRWSHRVTAMFHPSRKMSHPSRPPKMMAAHHARPLRKMAHHVPKTRQRSLNSFAQLPAQNDLTPDTAEAPRAAARPQAAETPRRAEPSQASETPQATDTSRSAETPQAAQTLRAAEAPQATETPQTKVTPFRPIDQIAGRFPAAAEFMTTGRGDTDGAIHDDEGTVLALEGKVAALSDTTPTPQATDTVDASEDGPDLQLVGSLLLMLGSLPTFFFWWWFRARRDAARERDRLSTSTQVLAEARRKSVPMNVASELGPRTSLQSAPSAW
jgi:hypothetical protein